MDIKGVRLGWFAVILVAVNKVCGGNHSENHLVDRLLTGYNTDARPVKNGSSPVTVGVDIALAQLINVNDREQHIMVNIWMRQYWTDEYLSWDPEDYYGLDVIRVQSSAIWRPDIVIYNGIFDEGFAELPDTKVTITSNGSVTYLYPFTFKASCKINVADFPHDTQTCPLKFGSWAFDGLAIDVVNISSHGDLEFGNNGIWTVIDLPAQRNVETYGASDVPYPDVTFHVVIQRQSLFYVFFIFFPSVLIVLIRARARMRVSLRQNEARDGTDILMARHLDELHDTAGIGGETIAQYNHVAVPGGLHATGEYYTTDHI
ncbi:hypothetical protein Bbelb_215340 [Branchiostoma belcheri]|nr:hypothetical protein Bbelb_215340 [Branchiostoma belcheri]